MSTALSTVEEIHAHDHDHDHEHEHHELGFIRKKIEV